jgi:capsular polysaccharide transport system permease protein
MPNGNSTGPRSSQQSPDSEPMTGEAAQRDNEATRERETSRHLSPARETSRNLKEFESPESYPTRHIEQITELPPLPELEARRSYGAFLSFFVFVVVPVALAVAYFGFHASDQYVAEFKFAVRDSRTSLNAGANGAGISSLLGVSTSPNTPENYMVTDYMKSRQAVDDLLKKVDLIGKFSRADVDAWARFDASLPIERLVDFWQRMVSASYDQVTGIAIARVRAFTPDDANTIAQALLSSSEEIINKTANRPIWDAVKFAEEDLRRAEERLKVIRAELTTFRNVEQVIEPNSSVVSSNAALAATLRATLTQLQTEQATLLQRGLAQTAPAMVSLQTRINATKAQLASIEAQVGTDQHGKPLSTVVGRFEQLDLERQFAQANVLSTLQALEKARANALAQQIYVIPYVQPAVPQSSTYPRRVLSVVVTGLVSFMLWTVGLLVVRAIREHIA